MNAATTPELRPAGPADWPIYRGAAPFAGDVWFYAPGYLALVNAAQADQFAAGLSGDGRPKTPVHMALLDHAERARRAWAEAETRPFTPICLILYLNNVCNLACAYCYAAPRRPGRLKPAIVRAAAERVAENCRAQGRALIVAFHGGGEPSLDQALAEAILRQLDEIAQTAEVRLFRYVATNGVMSPGRAGWLAARFDLIGLSCDGPAPIQARQRPLAGGGDSTPWVERTARCVHAAGRPLHIRVTITPATVDRQAEIADYVCRRLRPQAVHVEPVYGPGGFDADQAPAFVSGFLEGRAVARSLGVSWTTSGSRPDEIHGPYCQVFRDVLHLVPGGAATACFQTVDAEQAHWRGTVIGRAGPGQITLDEAGAQSLRGRLRREPARCAACFNRYHCARDCPDRCALDAPAEAPGFRCRAHQGLALEALRETARRLRAGPAGQEVVVGGVVGGGGSP